MQFTTWNAFIVSTFALLSLVTPVANAVDLNWVARIVQPRGKPGVSSQSNQTVVWVVNNTQTSNLNGVSCNITLMHKDPKRDVLVSLLDSNVPLLQNPYENTFNDTLTIPIAEEQDEYYLALVSLDGQTTYAHSDYFKIYMHR